MRKIPLVLSVSLVLFGFAAQAEVTVTQDGTRVVLANEHLRVVIATDGGGRIAQLVDKHSGKDFIAMWKGVTEIGGALDDRLFFTNMPYQATIVEPGGEKGAVGLAPPTTGGIELLKTVQLVAGKAIVFVNYTIHNGSQASYEPWV